MTKLADGLWLAVKHAAEIIAPSVFNQTCKGKLIYFMQTNFS